MSSVRFLLAGFLLIFLLRSVCCSTKKIYEKNNKAEQGYIITRVFYWNIAGCQRRWPKTAANSFGELKVAQCTPAGCQMKTVKTLSFCSYLDNILAYQEKLVTGSVKKRCSGEMLTCYLIHGNKICIHCRKPGKSEDLNALLRLLIHPCFLTVIDWFAWKIPYVGPKGDDPVHDCTLNKCEPWLWWNVEEIWELN